MGEFKKTWFQIVWACLLLVSIVITYIQRMSDALWVHSEAMQILDRTLTWVMLPLSVVLTVCMCIGYWRQSERLFWRKWRRWGASLAFGAAAAALLVVLVHLAKGEKATIEEEDRTLLLGAFSAAGLIWYFARYKFRSWRGDE
ncbi:MAG: hypothetical protein II236_02435 [Alistipes sp.]|nr:hypothetical protein [Alistipes sp.]MBQ5922584.1 hypothetical protein [Alistipes sp.]